MPTSKTKVDIAPLLSIYCGEAATISGPDDNGDYTISIADDLLSQEQLDFAVAGAAKDILIDVNQASIMSKMKNAVSINKTYLDLTTPTNAQVMAQVKSLTRQMNSVIKILGKDLADTDGT